MSKQTFIFFLKSPFIYFQQPKTKCLEKFLDSGNNNILLIAVAILSALSVAAKITHENDTEEL